MNKLVGPWRGYSGTSWGDETYHRVGKIILEESRSGEIGVGPWGGNGGTSWDDGIYHGVREINLVFGHCIDLISVVYDKNGMPVAAEKHGGVGGNQTTQIKLQSPDEYLVSVSGYYSPMVRGGSPVIRSLSFKSNKRRFGPFGTEHGTPFSSPTDDGWIRIVGFKGRSGHHLDAIGVHVARRWPVSHIKPPRFEEKVGIGPEDWPDSSESDKPTVPFGNRPVLSCSDCSDSSESDEEPTERNRPVLSSKIWNRYISGRFPVPSEELLTHRTRSVDIGSVLSSVAPRIYLFN